LRPLSFSNFLVLFAVLAFGAWTSTCQAQTNADNPYYARRNTFGVLGAYSGDSSHILLGDAENRMLLDFGVTYERRLLLNRVVNWQYSGELLPVALESDPLTRSVNNQTSPTTGTYIVTGLPPIVVCTFVNNYRYSFNETTYSGTDVFTCSGRRWTMGEAISPAGFQWNFLPRRKTQPFITGHGGYMYSTRSIPVDGAGSFNFTFDLGAGFELYRSKTKSIRVEYRYHHISDDNTSNSNPGIDNGLFQVTYCFRLGRR
jgi:opacity protein-like surface antigen